MGAKRSCPSANPFYSFQEVTLGDDERALLAACGRGFKAGSLLAKPERLRRAVYALLESGDARGSRRRGVPARRPAPIVRLHGEAVARRERQLDVEDAAAARSRTPRSRRPTPVRRRRPLRRVASARPPITNSEAEALTAQLLDTLSRPAESLRKARTAARRDRGRDPFRLRDARQGDAPGSLRASHVSRARSRRAAPSAR